MALTSIRNSQRAKADYPRLKKRPGVLFGNVKVVNVVDAFCSGFPWNFVAPFDALTCQGAEALMSRK